MRLLALQETGEHPERQLDRSTMSVYQHLLGGDNGYICQLDHVDLSAIRCAIVSLTTISWGGIVVKGDAELSRG